MDEDFNEMINGMKHLKRVGYAYILPQVAKPQEEYSAELSLEKGTIFSDLDLPMGIYGE